MQHRSGDKVNAVVHASPQAGATTCANWFGALAPKGTPLAIVSKLHAEMAKALANKEVVDSIWRQGAEPLSITPGEFESYLKSEIAKWAKTVDRAGICME